MGKIPCVNDDLILKSEGEFSNIFFEYLALQCEDISHLLANRVEWEVAYNDRLNQQYQAILPYLPSGATRLMDIGSGLGGIDVLLHRHYDGGIAVTLVDGKDDPPSHLASDVTYNNEDVTVEFLKLNGIENINYIPSGMVSGIVAPGATIWQQDLIISNFACSYDFSPVPYIPFIARSLRDDRESTLIFDVRKGKDWLLSLEMAFGKSKIIQDKDKYTKRVFHASK